MTSAGSYFNGRVYVNSYDGVMYALDAESGEEVWRFQTGGPVFNKPAILNGALYFGSRDGFLYALDPENGKLKWKFKTGGPVISLPAMGKAWWLSAPTTTTFTASTRPRESKYGNSPPGAACFPT